MDRLDVEWKKLRFEIKVRSDGTVRDMKNSICKYTGIEPNCQLFDNLNLKEKNLDESCTLSELNLASDFVLIVSSTMDKDEPETSKTCGNATMKKEPLARIEGLSLEDQSEKEPNQQIKLLHTPRQNKNLLVLDIDATICDILALNTMNKHRAARPYLQEFLTAVYQDYDIALWSATNMQTIKFKMDLLGVNSSPNYTIVFCLDECDMVQLTVPGLGPQNVKPLHVIWSRFKEYNPKNTLICDDLEKNFYLNKQNGLQVKPYYFVDYEDDKELEDLTKYLKYIGKFSDLTVLNHSNWRQCPYDK